MTARRSPDFRLDEAVLDPGFSPRRTDAEGLVGLVVAGGDVAEGAERSLLRLGHEAGRVAMEHVRTAEPKARARLVAIVGKAALDHGGEDLEAFLVGALRDEDPRARRAAANALGKLRGPKIGEALSAALATEEDASVRRALAAAVGKAGGTEALSALSAIDAAGDELLSRVTAKASIMIQRTASRDVPSSFEQDKPAPEPIPVALHCRAGLASILQTELEAELAPQVARDDRVLATLVGPPARLFQARTMLFFGFPLPTEKIDPSGDVVPALTRALTSSAARRIFEHFTAGPIRFRIAWASGGKRRASTWRAAEQIAAVCPSLVNDPTGSTWEALVSERQGALEVELCPRVVDPRFGYRTGDVPAASHPTLAAALVRVAGVRPDDVVWDPFVGSGTELVERALAGPYAKLIGTDLDPDALEVARKNLNAAGVPSFVLALGDARNFVPRGPRPTLVVTNPPMGRRVLRGLDLEPFLDHFLAHAADVVCPGGRIAWIAPIPAQSDRAARALGLERTFAERVDMGGFDARLEVLFVPLERSFPRERRGQPPRRPRAF